MIRTGLVLGIVVFLFMLPLGAADHDDPVINATAPPQQEMMVTGCGVLNEPNTIYYLQNEILEEDFVEDICFTIAAPRVTLDCGRKGISSDTRVGTAIFTDQPLTEIYNCNIKMKAPESYGIQVYATDTVLIQGNAFAFTDYPLLFNEVSNARIKQNAFDQGIGVITLQQTTASHIEQNTFLNPGYALLVKESSTNQFIDNRITGCTDSIGCVMIRSSSGNHFTGLSIADAVFNALFIDGTQTADNRFTDTTITNSGEYDVLITGEENGAVTFVNSTYDRAKERVDSGNTLIRSWFLTLRVADTTNQPVADAQVEGTPNQGETFIWQTNNEGQARGAVVDYRRTGEAITPLTYALRISRADFEPYETTLRMSENQQQAVVLAQPSSSSAPAPSSSDEPGQCRTAWICTEWSACTDGTQTRSCDLQFSQCLPRNNAPQPTESQTCTTAIPLSTTPAESQSTTPGFISRITGAVIGANRSMGGGLAFIGLLAVVAAGYVGVGLARKRMHLKK